MEQDGANFKVPSKKRIVKKFKEWYIDYMYVCMYVYYYSYMYWFIYWLPMQYLHNKVPGNIYCY